MSPPWTATIQRATGNAVRMRLELDEDARTLSFYDRGSAAPESPQFTYERLAGGLQLEGRFEDTEVVVVLRRQEEESLLRGRGFRWINEYPFNRCPTTRSSSASNPTARIRLRVQERDRPVRAFEQRVDR